MSISNASERNIDYAAAPTDAQNSNIAHIAQEAWAPQTTSSFRNPSKIPAMNGDTLDCGNFPYPPSPGLSDLSGGINDYSKSNDLLTKAMQELKTGDTEHGVMDLRRGLREMRAGTADTNRGAAGLQDLLSRDPDAQDGLNEGGQSISQSEKEVMDAIKSARGGNTNCSIDQLTNALKDLHNGQDSVGMASEFLTADKKDADYLTPQTYYPDSSNRTPATDQNGNPIGEPSYKGQGYPVQPNYATSGDASSSNPANPFTTVDKIGGAALTGAFALPTLLGGDITQAAGTATTGLGNDMLNFGANVGGNIGGDPGKFIGEMATAPFAVPTILAGDVLQGAGKVAADVGKGILNAGSSLVDDVLSIF